MEGGVEDISLISSFEADNYPTDESLTRTFRQMIVMFFVLGSWKSSRSRGDAPYDRE